MMMDVDEKVDKGERRAIDTKMVSGRSAMISGRGKWFARHRD